MVTTLKGENDIPGLPEATRKAHICSELAHTRLLMIKTLVNAGCEVDFNKYEYIV